MTINQRQHQRRDIQLQVLYKSIGSFLNDYTANISIGGCFLNTEQPFAMGEQIELVLVLPSGQNIQATAIVRWVSQGKSAQYNGVGVQFTVLSADDQRLIERLVAGQSEQ